MMQTGRPRRLDRLQNIAIALLSCTALLLVGQTGLFQGMTGQTQGQGSSISASGFEGTLLSREIPVALLTQTEQGRYGVHYDQTAAEELYRSGLDQLLLQALSMMEEPDTVSAEDWQQAVLQGENWVCYDFLYNIPFDSNGEGRVFLLTGHSGWVETVCYYDQTADVYYQGEVKDLVFTVPKTLKQMEANEGQFAFEREDLAEALPGYTIVLPEAPVGREYQVSAPVETIDREALLERLDFNVRASAVYESADSVVIREGADTLRIQKDGTISFHGPDDGEARYQAQSQRKLDLQRKAEELLDCLTEGIETQGQLRCRSVETLNDGGVELTFTYLLDGAQVQLWNEGWAARFVFQGADLASFEVHLRQYQATETTCAVLPEVQAVAAAASLEQQGKELRLYYWDSGQADKITPAWAVRGG